VKKVLFITYYWPPAGGATVNRIFKFSQYLPEFGWQPVILTTEGGDFPFTDESLLSEADPSVSVYRSKGFSLHKAFRKISPSSGKNFLPYGFTDDSKNSFMDNLSRRVKYNMIPDSRYPWYFSTHRKAVEIIRKENIDLIFSSSPPQTNHMIARKAAKKTGVPWVADFRDPWTDVFWLLDRSKRFRFIHRIDQRIERRTIADMNAIVTVGPSLVEILGRKTDTKIHRITNGYDERYFSQLEYSPNKKFRITYAGSLSREQDPVCFVNALELLKENRDFFENTEILFLGNFPGYLHDLFERSSYREKILYSPYTFYADSLKVIAGSELLLMIVPRTRDNKCILTSKLFDYIGAGRPVLSYGPVDGDAADVLRESGTGRMFAYENASASAEFIMEHYHMWKTGAVYSASAAGKEIQKYSRRNLTAQLAEIFNASLQK
jgi:glycosyltransferase involved in cell wall biosynthesis